MIVYIRLVLIYKMKRSISLMKPAITTLIVVCMGVVAKSQHTGWDVYLAQYDDGVGSTTLNMDLIHTAPVKALPFVVVTGVTVKECPEDGLPSKLDDLYKISDDVNQLISSLTKIESVGTFMCQCERLQYIYVADTSNIRDRLTNLYRDKYGSYAYYIDIEPDPEWEAYLTFLYPNEETLEYMSNIDVVEQLEAAGDKPKKSRLVDHWLYFKSTADRDAFVKYAKQENFKVERTDFLNNSELPYQLHISRVDPVDIQTISALTLALRKKAWEFNGKYDGWESVVVKK